MPRKRKWEFTVSSEGEIPQAVWDAMRQEARLYAGRPAKTEMSPLVRSSDANRYYWGVVLAEIRKAAVESGQPVSSEALHGYFKSKYLDPDVNTVAGVPMVVYTTTNLDSTQFYEYVESIRHDPVVESLGCHIPDPETDLKSWRIADP